MGGVDAATVAEKKDTVRAMRKDVARQPFFYRQLKSVPAQIPV
jgi:hypothetical protein